MVDPSESHDLAAMAAEDGTAELPLGMTPGKAGVISVMLPFAVEAPYSYRVPPGMTLRPGDIVEVPLSTRNVVGVKLTGKL